MVTIVGSHMSAIVKRWNSEVNFKFTRAFLSNFSFPLKYILLIFFNRIFEVDLQPVIFYFRNFGCILYSRGYIPFLNFFGSEFHKKVSAIKMEKVKKKSWHYSDLSYHIPNKSFLNIEMKMRIFKRSLPRFINNFCGFWY